MASKSKKNGKKISKFLKSTIFILLFVFLSFSVYGIYEYGLQKVIDESIFYLIGASFTALVFTIVTILFKSNNKRVL